MLIRFIDEAIALVATALIFAIAYNIITIAERLQ